jgi:hypothetical protein
MSDENFVGLSASKEVVDFSVLDAASADADSPFKDLRTLTKKISLDGTDVVYFEEIVRGSLEGRTISMKSSGKTTKKKPSLDELKSFYAESPIYRNTMRVELKVLKTLQVPSPQDASGLILNNTDLEHSVEKRLGVLAEEKMMENFPLNDAVNRSKLITRDRDERSSVPGCKGSYCEYVFNAMSLLAKKSFSKCHSQVPHHRIVLFHIPRKWIDQDKEDMLVANAAAREKSFINVASEGEMSGEKTYDTTTLPRINKNSSCVGSPSLMRQKKSESPAAYMRCRSSAASYDVLNVCENCFKIYGALHNIKKQQEYHRRSSGGTTVDQGSSSNNALPNSILLSPPTANTAGSTTMTPEPKKFEPSTPVNVSSAIGSKFLGSPMSELAKSTSPNSSPPPPNQSSPSQIVAKSASPLSRSRRKSTLGHAAQSDSSETGDSLTVDMEWRIKNFSQKQAAGKLDAESHGGHVARQLLEQQNVPEGETHATAEASAHDAVPVPVRDITELTRLLRHELHERLWDEDGFQREMRDEKYYFELCRNWDGKVAVLVAVENELQLLPPKQVLGMLAVNIKMPGFVKFSLLKPTFNAERKQRRALAEAKLRAKSIAVVQRRVASVS